MKLRFRIQKMSWVGILFVSLIAGVAGTASTAEAQSGAATQEVTLTDAEIEEDTKWLEGLGLQAPQGGYLLRKPFSLTEPLSYRSFATPISWTRLPAPSQVVASALLADFPYIQIALERTYSGYETAEARGWNWSTWLKAWDAHLKKFGNQSIAVELAFEPLRKLKEFQPDNHLSVVVQNALSIGAALSKAAILSQPPQGACSRLKNDQGLFRALDSSVPSHQPKSARILRTVKDVKAAPVSYISYPSTFGVATEIECASQWIALEPFWQNEVERQAHLDKVNEISRLTADSPSFREISKDVLYIRFPGTNYTHYDAYLELQAKILAMDLTPYRVFILDHRGNPGGHGFANTIYQYLSDGKFLKAEKYKRSAKRSCLSYGTGSWGLLQASLKDRADPLGVLDIASAQDQLDQMTRPLSAEDKDCLASIKHSGGSWNYGDRKFDPAPNDPIYLFITDRRCGSTCEGSLFSWAQLPNTLVIGANSLGVGQFTGGKNFIMPNSKIRFQFPAGVSNFYGDHRAFDGYGFDVDLVLPEEQMQSATYLEELAKRVAVSHDFLR